MDLDIFISVNYCGDLASLESDIQDLELPVSLGRQWLEKGWKPGREGFTSILYRDQHILLKKEKLKKNPCLFLVHKNAPVEYQKFTTLCYSDNAGKVECHGLPVYVWQWNQDRLILNKSLLECFL